MITDEMGCVQLQRTTICKIKKYPCTQSFDHRLCGLGVGWSSYSDMFTAGCDSVKWIFFLSAFLFLWERSSRSSRVCWVMWGRGAGHRERRPFYGGPISSLGGRVPGPARALTSARLPRSSGRREELSPSSFPLPAGMITMEGKARWGGGEPWILGPICPVS